MNSKYPWLDNIFNKVAVALVILMVLSLAVPGLIQLVTFATLNNESTASVFLQNFGYTLAKAGVVTGNQTPSANNTYGLGTQLLQWSDIWTNRLHVADSTVVTNLNADLLDGQHATNLLGNLGHSAFVIASNAPAVEKTYAALLQSAGYPVWVVSGNADDEIQAANDNLTSGGRIYNSTGDFPISTQVTISNNITLMGEGKFATRYKATANWAAAGQMLYLNGDGISIQDMTLDSNGANQSKNIHSIYAVSGKNDFRYSRIFFKDVYSSDYATVIWAAHFAGSRITLEDLTFENTRWAVYLYDAVDPVLNNIKIKTLTSGSDPTITGNGIYARAPTRLKINNADVDMNKNMSEGIDIHNFKQSLELNNVAVYNTQSADGTWITQVDTNNYGKFTINNYTAYNNGSSGLRIGRGQGGAGYIYDGVATNLLLYNNSETLPGGYPGLRLGDYAQRIVVDNVRAFDDHNNTSANLSSNANAGQKNIIVPDGTLFRARTYVTLSDDTPQSENVLIASISGNTLVSDTNLVNSYTTVLNAVVKEQATQKWGIKEGDYVGDATGVDYITYGGAIDCQDVAYGAGYIPIKTVGTHNRYAKTQDYTFIYNDVSANMTATSTTLWDGVRTNYILPFSGHIIAASIYSNAARIAGTASAVPFIAGAQKTIGPTLNGTDTTQKLVQQGLGVDTFSAGNLLDVRLWATDWGPTTADINVTITVKFD